MKLCCLFSCLPIKALTIRSIRACRFFCLERSLDLLMSVLLVQLTIGSRVFQPRYGIAGDVVLLAREGHELAAYGCLGVKEILSLAGAQRDSGQESLGGSHSG